MDRIRTVVQIAFAAVTNGYYKGFAEGTIFKGDTKNICLPGLNCYSCPGAIGSCPIGSLQAVSNDRNFHISFYVIGFLALTGALLGRSVCGWLCPFGLVQDLLFKIPFIKKIRKVPGDRILKVLKYLILAIFVIILPIFVSGAFGQGDPYFCKYICPSGTLMAGWPLILLNSGLRAATGFLFTWKSIILIIVIIISIIIYRPFCRWLCPLGAIYGMCNRISLYRYEIDHKKCTECGTCQRVCKLDIKMYKEPNSTECIRCGDCQKACPEGAITVQGMKKKLPMKKEVKNE